MADDLDRRAAAGPAWAAGVSANGGRWPTGSDTAEVVAAHLELMASLDPRWHLLPDPSDTALPLAGHLLVGPAGVFLIRPCDMAGARVYVQGEALWSDGSRRADLDECQHEADRVHEQLSALWGRDVPVTAVLVPLGPRELAITVQPLRSRVVTRLRLVSWLASRPERFADESVDAIHRLALAWSSLDSTPGSRSG
jgi:hypothetical protein